MERINKTIMHMKKLTPSKIVNHQENYFTVAYLNWKILQSFHGQESFLSFFFSFFFVFFFIFSRFCHTLKWNSHGFTCVPHPDLFSTALKAETIFKTISGLPIHAYFSQKVFHLHVLLALPPQVCCPFHCFLLLL